MLLLLQTVAQQAAGQAANLAASRSSGNLTHYFFRLGFPGLFLIAAIDASPIPLSIPGTSDLLVVLLAAHRHAWLLVTVVATLGSIVGASISYQAGAIGGMPLMNRYMPEHFREHICRWTEEHAILSVALPAILPPPAPLTPFLMAAGALKIPRTKFYNSFILSRFARYAFYSWLGLHYGRHIMHSYTRYADQYGWILLVLIWGSIIFGITFAIVKLRQSQPLEDVSEVSSTPV